MADIEQASHYKSIEDATESNSSDLEVFHEAQTGAQIRPQTPRDGPVLPQEAFEINFQVNLPARLSIAAMTAGEKVDYYEAELYRARQDRSRLLQDHGRGSNTALSHYQLQLALLEVQNRLRTLTAKQEMAMTELLQEKGMDLPASQDDYERALREYHQEKQAEVEQKGEARQPYPNMEFASGPGASPSKSPQEISKTQLNFLREIKRRIDTASNDPAHYEADRLEEGDWEAEFAKQKALPASERVVQHHKPQLFPTWEEQARAHIGVGPKEALNARDRERVNDLIKQKYEQVWGDQQVQQGDQSAVPSFIKTHQEQMRIAREERREEEMRIQKQQLEVMALARHPNDEAAAKDFYQRGARTLEKDELEKAKRRTSAAPQQQGHSLRDYQKQIELLDQQRTKRAAEAKAHDDRDSKRLMMNPSSPDIDTKMKDLLHSMLQAQSTTSSLTSVPPHALQDYQTQLRLLEQQNQKKLIAREANDIAQTQAVSSGSWKPPPRSSRDFEMQRMLLDRQNKRRIANARGEKYDEPPIAMNIPGSRALQDYDDQLKLLEDQNKKRLEMARQEQDQILLANPNNTHFTHPMQEHQMQKMLLEQKNKRKIVQAVPSMYAEQGTTKNIPGGTVLQDDRAQMNLLPDQNKRRAETTHCQQQDQILLANSNRTHFPLAAQIYQMRMMLLAEQNQKSLEMTGDQRLGGPSADPKSTPFIENLQRYHTHLMSLEQQNQKRWVLDECRSWLSEVSNGKHSESLDETDQEFKRWSSAFPLPSNEEEKRMVRELMWINYKNLKDLEAIQTSRLAREYESSTAAAHGTEGTSSNADPNTMNYISIQHPRHHQPSSSPMHWTMYMQVGQRPLVPSRDPFWYLPPLIPRGSKSIPIALTRLSTSSSPCSSTQSSPSEIGSPFHHSAEDLSLDGHTQPTPNLTLPLMQPPASKGESTRERANSLESDWSRLSMPATEEDFVIVDSHGPLPIRTAPAEI